MSPYLVAFGRGVLGGVVLAGSAFFSQLATGSKIQGAGIAAGVAFFGYLALRFGVEGTIDNAAKPKA